MTNFDAFDFSKNPLFDPKNNPFLSGDKNPFLSGDMATAFPKMDVPADLEAFFAPVRKNVEAVAAANKVALDGVKAVLKRQGEILNDLAADAATLVQDAKDSAGADPQDLAAKNVETAKLALNDAVANTRELGEMLAKSQEEAFDVINVRLAESLDEVKAAFAKMPTVAPAKKAAPTKKGPRGLSTPFIGPLYGRPAVHGGAVLFWDPPGSPPIPMCIHVYIAVERACAPSRIRFRRIAFIGGGVEPTGIDRQHHAGDRARGVGTEEMDAVGNVFRQHKVVQRAGGHDLVRVAQPLVDPLFDRRRQGIARRHAVDPHAVRPQLAGHHLDQRLDRRLARIIGRQRQRPHRVD